MQICAYKNDNKEGLVWKRKADKQSPTKRAAKERPAARSQVLFINTRKSGAKREKNKESFHPHLKMAMGKWLYRNSGIINSWTLVDALSEQLELAMIPKRVKRFI